MDQPRGRRWVHRRPHSVGLWARMNTRQQPLHPPLIKQPMGWFVDRNAGFELAIHRVLCCGVHVCETYRQNTAYTCTHHEASHTTTCFNMQYIPFVHNSCECGMETGDTSHTHPWPNCAYMPNTTTAVTETTIVRSHSRPHTHNKRGRGRGREAGLTKPRIGVTQMSTHWLRKSNVIFCGERPILSLMLSLRPDTVVEGERVSSKEGPMVGCTRTHINLSLSRSRL